MVTLQVAPDPRRERLARDLPVAWDGVPVTWSEEAMAVGATFICPPEKIPPACPSCGQLQADGADSYIGKIAGEPVPTSWTRNRYGQVVKVRGWATVESVLVATRCLGCGHDQVYDLRTDELWDLDDTDYGDAGSIHPDDVQGQLW